MMLAHATRRMPWLVTSRVLVFSATLLLTAVFAGSVTAQTTQSSGTLGEAQMEEQYDEPQVELTRDVVYEKMLGMLVGSAIGDALGAPTEMWHREKIQAHFNFAVEMRDTIREASPEGSWSLNAPPGTTTDDTRWKQLVAQYVASGEDGDFTPTPRSFATFLVDAQDRYYKELNAIEGNDLDAYHDSMQKLLWLKEFVSVSEAYLTGDLDIYATSQNKFYGGDLACPGLLFCPVIGAVYPNDPDTAYETTYKLSIFDIGYGRDISGLAAAMTAAAMAREPDPESVLQVIWQVDPHKFFEARILGRIPYRIYEDARMIVHDARMIEPETELDAEQLEILQMTKAFEGLDEIRRQHQFHVGEIHLVNLTTILFADWDFERAMRFVISYGRDNDTTAAVTGAVLGAYHGIDGLPERWVTCVLERNLEMGINLEALAEQLTDVAMTNVPQQ